MIHHIRLERSQVVTVVVGPEMETLQERRDFWKKRALACQSASRLQNNPRLQEMVVAHTATVEELHRPETFIRFTEENQQFVRSVWNEIHAFVEQAKSGSAMELFSGPGHFTVALGKNIQRLFAVELDSLNVKYLRNRLQIEGAGQHVRRVITTSAHLVFQNKRAIRLGLTPSSLDAVFAFRGLLHEPNDERTKTLKGSYASLKKGGKMVIGEMFLDDKPPGRLQNPGTWYWKESDYSSALPNMELIHRSTIIMNETDPCRVLVFEKK